MTELLYIIEVEPNVFLKTSYIEMGEFNLERELKPHKADIFESEKEAMELVVDIEEGITGATYHNRNQFTKLIVKPVSLTVHDSSIE